MRVWPAAAAVPAGAISARIIPASGPMVPVARSSQIQGAGTAKEDPLTISSSSLI